MLRRLVFVFALWQCLLPFSAAWSASPAIDFPATIARIKPSIVGVGSYEPTRSPEFRFFGTGFAVSDGSLIATNSHVVPFVLETDQKEKIVVAIPTADGEAQLRDASIVERDPVHDLVLLRIRGTALPPVELGDSDSVREGELFGFIGFPLGGVIGLFPATHRGIISAIAPIAMPQENSTQLDTLVINRLRKRAFTVFQLDATAYPGNSGSPLFDESTGAVVAIINKVFVKGSKEVAITHPSGITYAIPINYLRALVGHVVK